MPQVEEGRDESVVGGVTLPLFNSRGLLKMVRASLASIRTHKLFFVLLYLPFRC
jgi:hypothetical protein